MTIKVDHYLTHSQIKDILAATYNENMELVLSLMFYCGLRVTEALNIHKHTIIKDPSQVPYPRIVLKGKGDKTRTVRITNKALANKLKSRVTKIPLTRQAVRQHIVRTAKKMEWYETIPFKIGCHTFRHSAAHYFLMNGVPINELQSFLGHSSIVITQLYLKTNQLNSESWNIE